MTGAGPLLAFTSQCLPLVETAGHHSTHLSGWSLQVASNPPAVDATACILAPQQMRWPREALYSLRFPFSNITLPI